MKFTNCRFCGFTEEKPAGVIFSTEISEDIDLVIYNAKIIEIVRNLLKGIDRETLGGRFTITVNNKNKKIELSYLSEIL